VKVRVCRPLELGTGELARWRQFQYESPGLRHPFLSPEFARALDTHNDRARVAVVEDGGRSVGFFPFDHAALGVAKPLGGRLGYRQGFVHEANVEWSWAELLRASGRHVVEFTDLSEDQAARQNGLEIVESPIVDTSCGWDKYLEAARPRRRIKNTMYLERKLGRDHGPVEFTWGPTDAAAFTRLIEWKSEQYRRSGWRDPFSHRWVRTMLDELAHATDSELRPVFSALHAGGDLLAVDLSLEYQGVYAGWISAYNTAFSNYSPGAIRMLRTVEHGCADGFAYIDLARGDEVYKRSFKNAFLHVGSGVVHEGSASAFLYRAARAPGHATRTYILERPRVRAFVRSSLRQIGTVRATVGRRSAPTGS
jgi:CelD/BcsL family acetyltransferase involved in cellulose biosynthesis